VYADVVWYTLDSEKIMAKIYTGILLWRFDVRTPTFGEHPLAPALCVCESHSTSVIEGTRIAHICTQWTAIKTAYWQPNPTRCPCSGSTERSCVVYGDPDISPWNISPDISHPRQFPFSHGVGHFSFHVHHHHPPVTI